jgi:hypothetical protein
MATLRIGYDVFAGSSQAGTDASVPGNIQLETAKALKYKLKVQRLSDNYYWNNTTPAWQAGAVAEADELDFFGSFSNSGQSVPATRRLKMKLPAEVLADIDADGFVVVAYAAGDTPATEGVSMTLTYKPTTA